ncbi:MAG: helix-turn-helix domain-containing protein [Firmicutes bacterium]|nr:helix-turn-helix domain-containing protein [Bacillota bacterium]
MNKQNVLKEADFFINLKEKLGERIKDLRKERGLNQIQTAEALKIDKSTIAKYETDVSAPSVFLLIDLAEFFEVSTDYLLGLEE